MGITEGREEFIIDQLPGQHVCAGYIRKNWRIHCDVIVYKDWCHSGPMMTVNGKLMIKIVHCPICGERLNGS